MKPTVPQIIISLICVVLTINAFIRHKLITGALGLVLLGVYIILIKRKDNKRAETVDERK